MSAVADRLREAAASLGPGRVSVDGLLQAHGPAAHGGLMMLMAVPCMLPVPGAGTVLGCGLVALAVAMWRGQGAPAQLPRKVAELEMSSELARRVLHLLASLYALAGRLARSRLVALAPAPGGAQRGLAAWVALMAVLLILPIPFGNVAPALALILIGLGLVFRDGLAVVLGAVVGTLGTLALSLVLLSLADWGWGMLMA